MGIPACAVSIFLFIVNESERKVWFILHRIEIHCYFLNLNHISDFIYSSRIADAEENLGESEVREAHLAKSLFYIRIGDKACYLLFIQMIVQSSFDHTGQISIKLC